METIQTSAFADHTGNTKPVHQVQCVDHIEMETQAIHDMSALSDDHSRVDAHGVEDGDSINVEATQSVLETSSVLSASDSDLCSLIGSETESTGQTDISVDSDLSFELSDVSESECMAQGNPKTFLPGNEALEILACFLRNSLSASTSKDILQTMQKLFGDKVNIPCYEQLWKSLYVTEDFHEYYYCEDCYAVVGNNVDTQPICPDCVAQPQERRLRRKFILADVKHQLKNLLETPGMFFCGYITFSM